MRALKLCLLVLAIVGLTMLMALPFIGVLYHYGTEAR